jgi:hypothetical protein
MKQLVGKTDLWRFPVMCEEIWAGVGSEAFPIQSNVFEKHSPMENHHVSSSQHNTQQAQVIA